ncbi:hypothetical protein ACFFVB_05255 [Formosa undariae]|uniref:Lipoprotein n=1 Tax=Formosa undariae TaxID=1325436 RepID=A0ABV5EZ59_9FLAO
MEKLKCIGILFVIGLCFSCSVHEKTQEQEAQNLNQLYSEIKNLATSENCNDATTWTFTPYGNKVCGGPVGYIAYSTTIDTELFLETVAQHRTAEKAFNEKWGMVGPCNVPPQPTGISCEDGHPVLEYR